MTGHEAWPIQNSARPSQLMFPPRRPRGDIITVDLPSKRQAQLEDIAQQPRVLRMSVCDEVPVSCCWYILVDFPCPICLQRRKRSENNESENVITLIFIVRLGRKRNKEPHKKLTEAVCFYNLVWALALRLEGFEECNRAVTDPVVKATTLALLFSLLK